MIVASICMTYAQTEKGSPRDPVRQRGICPKTGFKDTHCQHTGGSKSSRGQGSGGPRKQSAFCSNLKPPRKFCIFRVRWRFDLPQRSAQFSEGDRVRRKAAPSTPAVQSPTVLSECFPSFMLWKQSTNSSLDGIERQGLWEIIGIR